MRPRPPKPRKPKGFRARRPGEVLAVDPGRSRPYNPPHMLSGSMGPRLSAGVVRSVAASRHRVL